MKTTIALLIISALCSPAYALKVINVKNDRVLFDLEGENLQVGDRVGARNLEGKPKAMVEITQIKNGRAIGAVVKGRMQIDYVLTKSTSGSSKSVGSRSKSGWGVMAGYAMNSMSVKPNGGAAVSLSGTSFNVSGFYQTQIDGKLSGKLLAGYETLQATGTSATAACVGSSDCKVNISYLGLEALVRYSFISSQTMDFWAGGGLGFLFAMSKESNILDASKISSNQTVVGSLGLDYRLSRNSFVPVQLDYAYYPDNNTSSANQIILRAGYGFGF